MRYFSQPHVHTDSTQHSTDYSSITGKIVFLYSILLCDIIFDINFLKTRFARRSGYEPNGLGYSFQSTWIWYDTSITPDLIDKIANQEVIIGPDVEIAEADLPGQ